LCRRNSPKQPEISFFVLLKVLWGIWAPLNGPEKVHRGPKVGRMHVPMFELENRPLKFFVLFWGIWAPPNGPKKVHTDPQVGGMYVSVSKLDNVRLTKSIGPF
jgi:hypothetical protein